LIIIILIVIVGETESLRGWPFS